MSARSSRRASVSLLFATALVPLMMLVGLAIDFGFYNEAQTQLDMAADASALHAARVAAQLMQLKDPKYLNKGKAAGERWFIAQEGVVPQAKTGSVQPTVKVTFDPNTKEITAQVTFNGVIVTHFAGFFPASWPQYPNWGIAGAATAVISVPSFNEVLMMLDNSSSMLIAADDANIRAMEELTPCSQQSAHEGQTIDEDYSWAYDPTAGGYVWNLPASAFSTTPAPGAAPNTFLPYGYGIAIYPLSNGTAAFAADIVPQATSIGACDINFTGPQDECFYPGRSLGRHLLPTGTSLNSKGQCTFNGVVRGGGPGSVITYPNIKAAPPNFNPVVPANMPQAPCAFACHNNPGNDYYALSRSITPKITLRYDDVQTAAGQVIGAMQTAANSSQLTVGVYQFNAPGTAGAGAPGITQVYPTPGSADELGPTEAGQPTVAAATQTTSIAPPVTGNVPDTNIENAITQLDNFVTNSGNGTNPASPVKYLFIVTDGMDDYTDATGHRVQQPLSLDACNDLKQNKGFTIYVLDTEYYPLPNPYYLGSVKAYVEAPAGSPAGTPSPVQVALATCSSGNGWSDHNPYFYKASNGQGISNAMKKMLQAALGSSGRLSD